MAKRYKKENRRFYKINVKKVLVFIIIIVLIIGISFTVIKLKNGDQIEVGNTKINTHKISNLTSDLLIPKDLNEEIINALNKDNMKLIKMNYKLESLENGKIELFYNVNNREILNLVIDLKSKQLEKTVNIQDEDLLERKEIKENINEDIKVDYEENKKRLKPEEGKNILNIIVTDTEIIINASQN